MLFQTGTEAEIARRLGLPRGAERPSRNSGHHLGGWEPLSVSEERVFGGCWH